MRHGGHVFDERDFQANGLQRANGRFPAGPWPLDPHLNLFHTVGHGLAGGILRHLLGGVGGALAGALETDPARRGPPNQVPMHIGDGHLRVVEGGEDVRFTFDRIGYSCKMNELEAAIGIGAMEVYHEILKKRHDNLLYVLERFDRFAPWLSTIKEEAHEQIGPHAIPIIINEGAPFSRADLTHYLEQNGIETRTLFASMPTQCPGFAYLGYQLGQFPNAEYMGLNGIHIGVHQDVGIEDMEYVLTTLEQFLQNSVPDDSSRPQRS